jgi:sulfatase modifying factor 1
VSSNCATVVAPDRCPRASLLGVGLAVAALVGWALVGCELLVGIPNVSLAPTDAGPCSRSLADGGARPGPDMVPIDSRLGSYCIDTTEVTVAQFNAYLIASGIHIDTPDACASAVRPPLVNNDPHDQNHPVGSVGPCDAWSYCRWAGKRLCGVIGDGGSIRNAAPQDTEWHYACTNGPLNTAFPYGQTYDPTACNTEGDGAVPVASKSGCHGMVPPFDRIYDLVGNRWEFVNDIGGPTDSNGGRGGSWKEGMNASCSRINGFNGFIYDFPESGFRCCADP